MDEVPDFCAPITMKSGMARGLLERRRLSNRSVRLLVDKNSRKRDMIARFNSNA
jgi:hypothetical protein